MPLKQRGREDDDSVQTSMKLIFMEDIRISDV